MTEAELNAAIDATIADTPVFQRAVKNNYLNLIFLEMTVRECARGKSGKLLPPREIRRNLHSAAGGGRRTGRLWLRKPADLRSTMLLGVADKIGKGKAGKQKKQDRARLEETLERYPKPIKDLLIKPGLKGSPVLDRRLTVDEINAVMKVLDRHARAAIIEDAKGLYCWSPDAPAEALGRVLLRLVNQIRRRLSSQFPRGLANIRRRRHSS